MLLNKVLFITLLGTAAASAGFPGRKKAPAEEKRTPLQQYIADSALDSHLRAPAASPGSLYQPGSRLADMGRDVRAMMVDDLVTIVVADKASALAKGVTNTSRKSSTRQSVNAIFGPTAIKGPLANLAGASGDTQIAGQGQTSREMTLSTTLTARVTHVMPNGNLVLEGAKDIVVNSERQTVTVRGVVRPDDLSGGNQVISDRLAMLEVHVNGKGVVGDAIRRPFILYRILLGLLPL